MDVGAVSTAQSALNAYQAGTARKTAETANMAANAGVTEEQNPHGDAFSVDISTAGKQAQAAATEETEGGEAKTKGLSSDQVEALMADIQEKSMKLMADLMGQNNDKLQDFLDNGVGKLNFGGVEIDAARFAMPEVATTPEEAEKALAEGGDWSVGKVADRIFGLAEALAGGDADKLEQMRSAVEKGFEQAGSQFKEHFGAKDTPQITKDTYNEIMSRFDKKAEELKSASALTAATSNQVQAQAGAAVQAGLE